MKYATAHTITRMSHIKEEVIQENLGLRLSLEEIIKRRSNDKNMKRKSVKTTVRNFPSNSLKSSLRSKVKRNATILHKRGLESDIRMTKYNIDREVKRHQRREEKQIGSRNSRVYIGNLSWDTTWQNLKDFAMREVGDVVHAEITSDYDGRSKGCGVLDFSSIKAARKACKKLNKIEFMGRHLLIREDRIKKDIDNRFICETSSTDLCVIVSNLPSGITWHSLKDHMRQVGNVERANLIGKSSGIVTYQHLKDAKRAIRQLHNSILDSNHISVREYHRNGRDETSKSLNFGVSVFVGNIPYEISWQDLKDHMRRCGNVDRADILKDFVGQSKGCAMVTYQHPKEAQRAIRELQDSILGGRRIFVRRDLKIHATENK